MDRVAKGEIVILTIVKFCQMIQAMNSKLKVILLTTFLNTLGIGLLIPVFPFLVAQFTNGNDNQTAFYTGILVSIYALCEFFVAPTLGLLSDKYGRKPILIFSLLGSAIGYGLLGIGGSLWILFLGRIIDGLSAGNISTIFAYVGDVSEPKETGKNFGLVGATLGVGFLLGPAIGGFLANYSLNLPMFLASGLSILNLLWIQFGMSESHSLENRITKINVKDLNPFGLFFDINSNLFLRTILIASFFHFVAFAQLQGNGSVLFKDALSWGPASIGAAFFIIGIVDIFMQGFLTEKLIPKYGEKKLAVAGLAITILAYLSWAFLPITHSVGFAYFSFVVFAFGTGLFEPTMASMVSQSAGRQDQGKAQGSYQSLQSLTRVIGPLMAGFLYIIYPGLPYFVSVFLVIISVILFSRVKMPKSE
jgi:MFS transporter, DHA1 family, tetracycline resistance protein